MRKSGTRSAYLSQTYKQDERNEYSKGQEMTNTDKKAELIARLAKADRNDLRPLYEVMNSGELLEKIRDVVGPQCEDASAAVIEVRELHGLNPKSGESVEPIGDFFSEVNRRSRAEGQNETG